MEAIAWVLGIGIFTGLLLAYPRRMGILLASIAAIGALSAAAAWGYFSWQEASQRRTVESLNFQVAWDVTECSADYPLKLTVHNVSGRELIAASFRFLGYRQGYSSPLYASLWGEYETDMIAAQEAGFWQCWRVPSVAYGVHEDTLAAHPPSTLTWTVTDIHPRFR